MKITTIIAYLLAIIGAIVWLLVGLFAFNPLEALFGFGVFTRIIYALVGIAGLWLIFIWVVRNPLRDL
ncbi:MAG: DUF378 domain-containing protein [Clostridia bacterium]|nr:DUF378 domain-containing protein [Clostridia bacterium]